MNNIDDIVNIFKNCTERSNYRVTKIRNSAMEKVLEKREETMVGNAGKPIGFANEDKSLTK